MDTQHVCADSRTLPDMVVSKSQKADLREYNGTGRQPAALPGGIHLPSESQASAWKTHGLCDSPQLWIGERHTIGDHSVNSVGRSPRLRLLCLSVHRKPEGGSGAVGVVPRTRR